MESGLNPNAKSGTSSAAGLFQFTEQTWLQTVKTHGAEYGLGNYAAQIQTGTNGTLYVGDSASREAILDLRKDPQVSAEMACELNNSNAQSLQKSVGGVIGPTELYLAHFLGASGAGSLLKAMRANPNVAAADLVPGAAKSNSSIFYGADGQARSVGQVYQYFAQKLDQPVGVGASATASVLTASSALQSSPSATASGFATMMLSRTNMAEVAAALMLDDEDESTVSVLA
jgi:hypothetical protein